MTKWYPNLLHEMSTMANVFPCIHEESKDGREHEERWEI